MTAEELRKSILQMAIQGRLVKQDPNDEPASVLLERIREEKTRLIKEGKIKGKMTDSVIYKGSDNSYYEKVGKTEVCIDDEIPFELPDGWAWTRVCDIVEIFTGASFKKEESTKNPHGIRVLRGGNIVPGQFFFKDDDIFIDSSLVKQDILLRTNDLITPAVSSIENIGKVARIDKKIQNTTAGGFVFIIRPIVDDNIFSQYLSLAFSNPYMVNSIKGITKKSGQAFYNIGKERLIKLLIPVAPQREQNKIVERLKEFEPFLSNYQALEINEREMYEQLPVMLRKSILQYAIQGKLVPQDPSDEPASVLLERIRSEREKANGGKKSKAKTESYIFKNSDDNSYYPFDIPKSWEWVCIGDIADIKGGKRIPAGRTLEKTDNGHIYIRVTDMKNMSIQPTALRYVPLDIVPLISKYTISKDDLYLTIAGTIGAVGIVPKEFDGMNLTENAVKITNISICKEYLMWAIASAFVQEQFVDKTNQVAQPKLAIERIQSS